MDKIFPEKIHNYFELIRLNKPIGFMLLLWPCWFSLAYLEFPQQYLFSYYILFFIGSVIMRSAGCIINDLVERYPDNDDVNIIVEGFIKRLYGEGLLIK